MIRNLVILAVLALITMPLTAESNTVNASYNMNHDYHNNQLGVRLTSFGLSWTYQAGEITGFQYRANPYLGYKLKKTNQMFTWLIAEDAWTIGSNFLAGYGFELGFNTFGFVLGGGLYTDINYYSYSNNQSYQLTSTTGIGAHGSFYFHPWQDRLIFTAGIVAAWAPFTLFNNRIFPGEWWTGFYSEQVLISLNVGVGWKTE